MGGNGLVFGKQACLGWVPLCPASLVLLVVRMNEIILQLIVVLFVGLIGLAVGSFVNVVIYRTLHGDSPTRGRSYCDHCKKLLRWYDNIPLFSFVMLKGKSRCCRKPISWQYPIVELMTALLFLWWYGMGFAFFKLTQAPAVYVQPLFWLVVGLLLLIIVVTDLRTYLIPDFAVFGLVGLGLIYRVYLTAIDVMQSTDLLLAVAAGLGLALAFAFIILLTRGKGMGWGDVKLAVAMGILLGWPRIAVAVMAAFVLGAAVGVGLIAVGKKRFGQVIPFGPFLVLGMVIGLVWGTPIAQWYLGML